MPLMLGKICPERLGNREGSRHRGAHFTVISPRVKSIERLYGLKSRYERLHTAGMLTRFEVADLLGITRYRVERDHKLGLLRGHLYNRNAEYLYEPPGPALKKRPETILADEVQYEA
jgi:hypothetical protein